MGFDIFENHLASAEGEKIVRSYHCSKLSPALAIFGLRVNGYVVVTNRRLVYFAEGSSGFGAVGNNRLYNEVPLAEVTNISMSQGTRFSLLRLIGGGLIAAMIVQMVAAVLSLIWGQFGHQNPYFLRAFIFMQIVVAAYLVGCVSQINKESVARILLSACSVGLILWGAQTQPLRAVFPGVNPIAFGRAMQPELIPAAYPTGLQYIALLAGCYFLWCLYWFVRRQYFEMVVTSRTNQHPSIIISGFSIFGKQIVNVSAKMASNLSPSIDAQALFKELGAVVSDIQATGDLGIQKWSQAERLPGVDSSTQTGNNTAVQRKLAWALPLGVLGIGMLVAGESIWYANMSANRQAALKALDEATRAKNAIESLSAAQRLAPKLLATAESENRLGQESFEQKEFVDSQVHWRIATTNYQKIPSLVKTLERIERLQRQFSDPISALCREERITTFDSKMDQYSQLEWSQIKAITNRAEQFRLNEQGEQSCNEWIKVPDLLAPALQKVKVGVWMEQAEREYKNKDWTRVFENIDKVLKQVPDHPRAIQMRDKAREALHK